MIATLEAKRAELQELCLRYRVRRLDVFGSAATVQGFDPQCSDLDFLVGCLIISSFRANWNGCSVVRWIW